jgi:hypothetical protein
MFEQTSRLAEKLAASVSRRGFLGSVGAWAAVAAMGVAGLFAFPKVARAYEGHRCCVYGTAAQQLFLVCIDGSKKDCPATQVSVGGTVLPLTDTFSTNTCRGCINGSW